MAKNKKGVEEYEAFQITSICLADLESEGYDITNVSRETMERLASKMADAYCDDGFWIDMEIIADDLKIKHKK